jgi:archaellum biogenesis protein FlaJ (TadC family)
MLNNMSFREKSTWISFVLLLAISIPFFTQVLRIESGRTSSEASFHLFLALVIVFIVGEIVLHAVIVMQSPRDARAPKDERERLIDLKAMRVAFFVLMTGALLVVVLVHFPVDRFQILQALLLAVVVAELTMLGARLVYYRRDV